MAILPSSWQLSHTLFSSPLALSPHKPHSPKPFLSVITGASNDPDTSTPESSATPSSPEDSDQFENRLSQLRIRNRSGLGKKAEARKARKGKKPSSTSGAGVFLPPVPLKEPVSEGLKVDFGFSPYSERLNGRIALLGLSALLLVELATGKSVIRYHSPSIVFVQIYFIATVAAVFVKYEKEKVSVWPESSPKK